MQNRTPVARAERPALPDFTPVPRQGNRHDGWTPARQRAFIEALADTGSVTRAARMVNMAQANCYTLRRAPGADEFRAAWEAALDFGLARLKDVAFERAMEGDMIPVFVGGKLMGFRRKRNDALLMFCLRHYGQDVGGKRTTINYFSTRASAGAGNGENGAAAAAEASTTTVRTVINGPSTSLRTGDPAAGALDEAALAGRIENFAGVTLDAAAQAAIAAALADCAARRRADDADYDKGGDARVDALEDDPGEAFVRLPDHANPYRGELYPEGDEDEVEDFIEDEPHWSTIGEDDGVAGPPTSDGETAPPRD